MKSKSLIVVASLILVIGMGLRIHNIGSKSIWMDEVMHSLYAKGSFGTIIEPKQGVMPAYTLILKLWRLVANSKVTTLRILSAILGTLTIFILFKLTNAIYGKGVAIISSLLLCLSPLHIFYSQQIGPYSLFVLAALLFVYSIFKLFNTGVWYWYMNFCFSFALLILTHLYSFFFILSLNIMFIFYFKKYKKIISIIFILQVAMFLIFADYFHAALLGLINRGFVSLSWIPRVDFYKSFIVTLRTFSYGGGAYGGNSIRIPEADLIIPSKLFFIYMFCCVFAVLSVHKLKKLSNFSFGMPFVLTWLFGGYAISYLISYFFMPIYVIRYILYSLPAFYILISIGIWRLRYNFFRFGILFIIVGLNIYTLIYYYSSELNFPWKKVVSYLYSRDITRKDLVIFDPEFQAPVLSGNDLFLRGEGLNQRSSQVYEAFIPFGKFRDHILRYYRNRSMLSSPFPNSSKRIFLIQSIWSGSRYRYSYPLFNNTRSIPEVGQSKYFSYNPCKLRRYFDILSSRKTEVFFYNTRAMKYVINDGASRYGFIAGRRVYIGEFYLDDNFVGKVPEAERALFSFYDYSERLR
ncbi:MAG: glycosyltransferase family 39 protein [Candidatus Omnitrophota bacterium]